MENLFKPLSEIAPSFSFLPKTIRSYLRFVRKTEPAPAHHLGVILTLLSQAIGGASYIKYGSKEVHMNLYTGLIAPSGFRKTEALRLGMTLYNTARERNEIVLKEPLPDIASNTAILQACDSRDGSRLIEVELPTGKFAYTSVFIVSSEFASFFRRRDSDMITLITNLFDGAVTTDTFSYRTQMGGHFRIVRPYTVLLMASTPEWLSNHLPKGATVGGFTNRFLFIYSEAYKPLAFPQTEPEIARLLEEAVEDFLWVADNPMIVDWRPEAMELFAKWYEETQGGILQEVDAGLHSWTSRLAIFLIKIAGISARADKRIYIEPQDLDFAWNLMALARRSTAFLYRTTGDNLKAMIEYQIVARIVDKGSIRISSLAKEFSNYLSAFELRNLLLSLSDLGVITLHQKVDRVEARGRNALEFLRQPRLQVDVSWDQLDPLIQEP